jgi:FG-GAP-like repeat
VTEPVCDVVAVPSATFDATDDVMQAVAGTATYAQGGPEAVTYVGRSLGGYSPIAGACRAAAADFDGDGLPDGVVLDTESRATPVTTWSGLYEFPASTSWTPPFPHTALATGDINGDGFDDLVLAGSELLVTVRFGAAASQGPFGASNPFGCHFITTLGTSAASLAIGDFDGDGREDIVSVSEFNNLTVSYSYR